MARAETPAVEGSYATPSFASALVSDAMRHGVMTCPPDTPLRLVARTMAQHHIHSVIVSRVDDEGRAWGVFSDLDLLRAAESDLDQRTAGEFAATKLITVTPDQTLVRAAQLMSEHEVAHLVVVDPDGERPVGVLSTLDVAGILAWGRA